MKDDEDEMELAILLEDYEAFDDEAHAARLHWVGENGTDYKPRVVGGKRIPPGRIDDRAD